MNLDKYKLLEDVAQTGNFTRSAERMGYSQSGVSHILSALENEMGFPLFVRSKKGVTMTQNCEKILPLIRKVLSEHKKLEQTVQEIKGVESGKIVIATYASISVHALPAVLQEFKSLHPNIEFELKEGGADNILQWVTENMVDIGFMSRTKPMNLEWISLGFDPLMAVLPKDDPLMDKDAFPIENFHEETFIISAAGTDYDIHEVLEKNGIMPKFKLSSTDDRAIMSMVMHHLGVSILSRLILTDYTDKLTVLPLKPFYARELGIAMRSYADLTPAARKFVEFVKQKIRL